LGIFSQLAKIAILLPDPIHLTIAVECTYRWALRPILPKISGTEAEVVLQLNNLNRSCLETNIYCNKSSD